MEWDKTGMGKKSWEWESKCCSCPPLVVTIQDEKEVMYLQCQACAAYRPEERYDVVSSCDVQTYLPSKGGVTNRHCCWDNFSPLLMSS